ncbi:C-type lectin domain family 17, member A-like [Argopecten irradians]|uniref:C-type lectin domain family 17, member A-like n=1 Tax=Argopecten irradians TaxID=31199 RepID=UPI0037151E0F
MATGGLSVKRDICKMHNCSDAEVCVDMKNGDHVCYGLDIPDVCPSDKWVPFNRKCYYFDSTRSLDENAVLCEGMDSKLIRVDNEEVNSFLKSEVLRRGFWAVWIGANDKDVEGEWKWGPGDPLSFIQWKDGEPSNAEDQDCVVINKTGYWLDFRCTITNANSACERPYNISTL